MYDKKVQEATFKDSEVSQIPSGAESEIANILPEHTEVSVCKAFKFVINSQYQIYQRVY